MPIFGRKKRKAAEEAERLLKDSATAGRPKYSMPGYGNRNGSGETKGNQPLPVQEREQQTPITPLETKPTEQPKLSRKERKENERLAKAAAAVQRRKDAMAKAASKKAAELKKTEQVDATARHEERLAGAIKKSDATAAAEEKWEASGGYSKASVKNKGGFTKTLKMNEIKPYNKKMRIAAHQAAKKKNPKGGTFTYEGFDSKGNKKTLTGKYGSAMGGE